MEQPLDISEVCRRTGLTSRALRFYEARGLVEPLRTYSGRRLYGPGELERINMIVALKRAGLTLSQIGRLTGRGPLNLGQLVDAQLAAIAERKAELREAEALLQSVKSRIDRGEPVDAATFCSLIRHGDRIMQEEEWKKVLGEHYSPGNWSIGKRTRRRPISTRRNIAGSGRTCGTGSTPLCRSTPRARRPRRSSPSGMLCSSRSGRSQRRNDGRSEQVLGQCRAISRQGGAAVLAASERLHPGGAGRPPAAAKPSIMVRPSALGVGRGRHNPGLPKSFDRPPASFRL